jgi:rubrerythrin
MIAQRHTSSTSAVMNKEAMVQTVMALLSQRHPMDLSRWDCNICGMIHTGQRPLACESCGNNSLSHQSALHREMNNHW